jgi:hypothetical protein
MSIGSDRMQEDKSLTAGRSLYQESPESGAKNRVIVADMDIVRVWAHLFRLECRDVGEILVTLEAST